MTVGRLSAVTLRIEPRSFSSTISPSHSDVAWMPGVVLAIAGPFELSADGSSTEVRVALVPVADGHPQGPQWPRVGNQCGLTDPGRPFDEQGVVVLPQRLRKPLS